MARPSIYSEELALKICSLIAHGKSLVSICKADDMPSVETVYLWLKDENKKEFLNTYARAREDQADTLADELIDIADEECTYTKSEGENGDKEIAFDSVAVARNRLRIDTRKWIASKLKPKKYGDKLDLNGDLNHNHQITKMVIELVEPEAINGS